MLDYSDINCYDIHFMRQFNDAIDSANDDTEIKVVLLKSASARCFCVGADVKAFLANDTSANKEMIDAARSALAKIEASSKIFIAVIGGHTLGGGLEMVMACDLRFAAEGKYVFGLPEVKLGLMPGNGGSVRLPRLIGASRALRLLVTGDNIGPEEAYRIGLVNELCSCEMIDEEAESYARTLAQGASLAIAAIKRSVFDGRHLSLQDALALEDSLVEPLYNSEDAAEGFLAFKEKREPRYRGR
ncbi:2,3-dehydroadipyl-CoA hydratase [Planctomycetes bacterium CA13]|uniref:2,3-dehydroadipyl-CoA hydratase n=2 Tax=Novipirellula herctigrandis TaxID=2527986 RepID=A0A5C5Z6B8_9BACT|nr:2,3-dehydroadipyl-CoA hydratase [Planctomycetes bacterium CA13]